MSLRNTLANKTLRRAERAENAARQEKKRGLQARIAELTMNEAGWLTADGPIMAEEIVPNDEKDVTEDEV